MSALSTATAQDIRATALILAIVYYTFDNPTPAPTDVQVEQTAHKFIGFIDTGSVQSS